MGANMFVKFFGVDGQAAGTGHEKWIEVLSWRHGFTQSASPLPNTPGVAAERAAHGHLVLTKHIDTATDDLLKGCWSGRAFKTVDLECFQAGGDNRPSKYLAIRLEDAVISQYDIDASADAPPVETLALSYSKVKYTYTGKNPLDASAGGAQPTSHDLRTNAVA